MTITRQRDGEDCSTQKDQVDWPGGGMIRTWVTTSVCDERGQGETGNRMA